MSVNNTRASFLYSSVSLRKIGVFCKLADISFHSKNRTSHNTVNDYMMFMKTTLPLFFIICVSACFAQTDEARKKHFNTDNSIAIDGYDPVSYFDGKPKEGDEDVAFKYKGVTYLFSSTTTLNKFKSNPEKYEPAYGGWCAYAMGATGEKVKIDPETFKIIDGRLFLFYNFWGNNTLEDWNKNELNLKTAADKNWLKATR
jgi:YHS domain-containing protein